MERIERISGIAWNVWIWVNSERSTFPSNASISFGDLFSGSSFLRILRLYMDKEEFFRLKLISSTVLRYLLSERIARAVFDKEQRCSIHSNERKNSIEALLSSGFYRKIV